MGQSRRERRKNNKGEKQDKAPLATKDSALSSWESFCRKIVSDKIPNNPFKLLEDKDQYKVFGVADIEGKHYQIAISPIQMEVVEAESGKSLATILACVKSRSWLVKLMENLAIYNRFFQEEEESEQPQQINYIENETN